jgi:hypothetical protein
MSRREPSEVLQALNGQPGLTLPYDPAAKRVKAEARPGSIMYIGTCPRTERTNKPMRPEH